MTKADVTRALLVSLIVLHTSVAAGLGDRCLTGTAPVVADDANQIRAARAVVDAACACPGFDGSTGRSHRDYVRCAIAAISGQVDAGLLRSKCKATVNRYYTKSTCGKQPSLHAQPCVQQSSRTGKIKCVVRSTTRRDGTTPTNRCTDSPGRLTRVSCPEHTHCIDAADTDGNLVIAAPGDSGSCAPSPTPTSVSTATAPPTPTPTPTAAECAVASSAAALAVNRAKWDAAGIDTYDVDYQRSCTCPAPHDVQILVSGGAITSVLDSGTGEEIDNPPTGTFGFNSVDGLFDVIAAAVDECVAALEVEYDPELGYPTSVFIDFVWGAVGDEIEIHINDLSAATIAMFPLALGACHFDPQCMDQSCMPSLSAVPSASTDSAWTAFFEEATTFAVGTYFPEECGGGASQRVRVGDMISINNGQIAPLLNAVSCLLADGQTTFTVPLIPCAQPVDLLAEVVGFARIEIDAVVTSGTPKGITLHGLWEE